MHDCRYIARSSVKFLFHTGAFDPANTSVRLSKLPSLCVVKIAYVSVDKDLNFANAWIQKAKVSLQAIQLTLTPAVETTRERGVAAGGPQMLATSNVIYSVHDRHEYS